MVVRSCDASEASSIFRNIISMLPAGADRTKGNSFLKPISAGLKINTRTLLDPFIARIPQNHPPTTAGVVGKRPQADTLSIYRLKCQKSCGQDGFSRDLFRPFECFCESAFLLCTSFFEFEQKEESVVSFTLPAPKTGVCVKSRYRKERLRPWAELYEPPG